MEKVGELFAGPWGPLIIFGLRIVDVSLSTVRILLVMRNARLFVPILACAETLVWIFAVGNAIRHLQSGWHLAGYSLGFATGNVVGMWLEGRLAFGYATVRVISRDPDVRVAEALREAGFGATEFHGRGREGDVELVYTVVRRRDIDRVVEEATRVDPDAFVTVEEPRSIMRGWMFQKRGR